MPYATRVMAVIIDGRVGGDWSLTTADLDCLDFMNPSQDPRTPQHTLLQPHYSILVQAFATSFTVYLLEGVMG